MWIDTSIYGTFDTVLFLTGFALWAPAYAIVALRAFRTRWVEIPLLGACADIAWDFLAGFVFKEHLGTAVEWFFGAAFLSDVLVVYAIVRLPPDHIGGVARRVFAACALAAVALGGLLVWAFRDDGLDTVLGTRSAYLAAALLSVGYLWRALSIDDVRRLSSAVAVCKLVADLLVTIFVFRHDQTAFARALAAVLTVSDLAYVAVIAARRAGTQDLRARRPKRMGAMT